ncbi:hypothetical protein AB0E67_32175 [Streptomyces sp. NPDC032161]|uniref:hypothetical protein n=1 Tax=unclassified Streptomyces TaxID=2593676 RepID=UPI00340A2231
MDPLAFDYENPHVRVDRGVFELFPLNSIETTLRVPPPWLGALVDYKKPDKPGELISGVVRDPQAAHYGTDRSAFRYRYTQAVRVPNGDEPLFRAYFTEVAAPAERCSSFSGRCRDCVRRLGKLMSASVHDGVSACMVQR